MYTVFESGAEEPNPRSHEQVMEEYNLEVLKGTENRALKYYESGVFIRARMEFEVMKHQGMELKDESLRLYYVQEANKHIATCDAEITKRELEAAKKPRRR